MEAIVSREKALSKPAVCLSRASGAGADSSDDGEQRMRKYCRHTLMGNLPIVFIPAGMQPPINAGRLFLACGDRKPSYLQVSSSLFAG
jgi:hypothetical protein